MTGDLPGFADAQRVAEFVTAQMETTNPAWHVAVAPAADESLPNRVEWNFKTATTTWGGGTHRGFHAPSFTRSIVTAEARYFVNDRVQATFTAKPTVVRGPGDASLAALIADATRALASRPAT